MSTTTAAPTTPDENSGSLVNKPKAGMSLRVLSAQAVHQLPEAVRKLDPRHMWRSPVMFLVWLGSIATTIAAVADPSLFTISIAIWLWLTVIFGNLAEAVAEGRGKAQAASLRAARSDTMARLLDHGGDETHVPGTQLKVGDHVVVEAGEVIPGDGDVVEGIASVDESAITGESAPVIREAGGDRSAVTGGTRVLSDRIVVRITAEAGYTFLDKMIALVEGTSRRKTPNEIALSILLASLTLVFLFAVATLPPMARYAGAPQDLVVLIALLVCLIPTTIGALLSAIGIAGMDRLVRVNVLAMSGRAVEAAGDVSTLLLDKTGTITYGNRQATRFVPAPGVSDARLRDVARLSSLADQTPEGRSIVDLALTLGADDSDLPSGAEFVEFTAQTRMSGVDLADGTQIRKGAGSAVAEWVGSTPSAAVLDVIDEIARSGGTPLVIAEKDSAGAGSVLGVVQLKDVVKAGHDRTVRRAARDGHPHRHDHRRQRPDRSCDRGRGRCRRLPGRGHARGQDGLHPQGAGGRAARRHDRRRHQRRPGARRRRRRRGHEQRHRRREGGRQHGRPRLGPDEADRHRRDRQAAAHHAWGADDLLDRQRRREVLRDHPGHVRRGLPVPGQPQRHGPGHATVRHPLGGHLQRADHRGA